MFWVCTSFHVRSCQNPYTFRCYVSWQYLQKILNLRDINFPPKLFSSLESILLAKNFKVNLFDETETTRMTARITSVSSTRIKKLNQLNQFMYGGNICRKDWTWIHLGNEQMAHEKQQMLDQVPYIFALVARGVLAQI